jgi:hypothetical protein
MRSSEHFIAAIGKIIEWDGFAVNSKSAWNASADVRLEASEG